MMSRLIDGRSNRVATPQSRPLGIEALSDRCLLAADPLSLAVDGPSLLVRGEEVTLTFNVANSTGNIFYAVDWEGDGVYDVTQISGPSLTLSREGFTSVGIKPVQAFAFDYTAGTLAQASFNISIETSRMAPNKYNPFLTDLITSGSDSSEFTLILPGSAFSPSSPADIVALLELSGGGLSVFSGVTGVVQYYANGGDDIVYADLSPFGFPSLPMPVMLYGGAGDDFLIGSVNGDFLDGQAGNDIVLGGLSVLDAGDWILGGNGQDVLIGGYGFDTVHGGNGGDILVAGAVNTTFLSWPSTILQARLDWVAAGYPRVRDRGDFIPGSDVVDDQVVDFLFGEESTDWFIRRYNVDVTWDLDVFEDYSDL